MQLFLKGHFQPIRFPKVERLKTGEVLYERPYLSHRPPPKISLRHDHGWTRGKDQSVLQLNISQLGKLVQQSSGEAPRVKLSKPTQSEPKPICDRSEKPEDTERVFVNEGKRPVPTRSMKSVCTQNLLLQIDRGNLRNCLKTYASSILTMEQGNLWSQAAQAHTVKEQFLPEENRHIASFNEDNEFNRATDEENVDFNIPGLLILH